MFTLWVSKIETGHLRLAGVLFLFFLLTDCTATQNVMRIMKRTPCLWAVGWSNQIDVVISLFQPVNSIFLTNNTINQNLFVFLQQIHQRKTMSTETMQQTIADYFKTQPVLKAWLFGSFARGEETPRSDVDILFVPDYSGKPFTLFTHGGMLMDLQELLGREVDLVVEGGCICL